MPMWPGEKASVRRKALVAMRGAARQRAESVRCETSSIWTMLCTEALKSEGPSILASRKRIRATNSKHRLDVPLLGSIGSSPPALPIREPHNHEPASPYYPHSYYMHTQMQASHLRLPPAQRQIKHPAAGRGGVSATARTVLSAIVQRISLVLHSASYRSVRFAEVYTSHHTLARNNVEIYRVPVWRIATMSKSLGCISDMGGQATRSCVSASLAAATILLRTRFSSGEPTYGWQNFKPTNECMYKEPLGSIVLSFCWSSIKPQGGWSRLAYSR
ncbi:hypothetical protein EJ04DRAFT_261898 [Polyplosphaeria fusca]|uniref:Uncharacterized protein n=1 Tax=Polyplosphaeria fusca TaxID=682080 RepID=A0A9P4RAN1_9PLEO|nr:hypothetical protein EJ04DRAFT_261898 [Polyplosphaeria fusca]